MSDFHLKMDPTVLELEQNNKLFSAAQCAYNLWRMYPNCIEKLLCAGTQLWYALLVNERLEMRQIASRLSKSPLACDCDSFLSCEPIPEASISKWLMEVTNWGMNFFETDAVFNSYFGYLIKVKPYFFIDYAGDYNAWCVTGKQMIKRGYALEPDNDFCKAIYFEDEGGMPYRAACQALWSNTSRETWGDSLVQDYFYRILSGPSL